MRDKINILNDLTTKLVNTYAYKNERYGDSFSKLREEYPIAICVRLSDKLSRLKTLKEKPQMSCPDESIKDTLLDLANYALMELMEMEHDYEVMDEMATRCYDCEPEEPNDYEFESVLPSDSHCCGTYQVMADTDESVTWQGKEYKDRRETCF